ncbi:MAG: hypothetical protein ACKVVP_07520 [Chloroflexota bacterium]
MLDRPRFQPNTPLADEHLVIHGRRSHCEVGIPSSRASTLIGTMRCLEPLREHTIT